MHSKTENLWWNFWLVRIHCSSVTSRGTVLRSSAVTIGTSAKRCSGKMVSFLGVLGACDFTVWPVVRSTFFYVGNLYWWVTHYHASDSAPTIGRWWPNVKGLRRLYLRFRIDLHADRTNWNACQYKNHCRNWVYNWATRRATTGLFLNPTTFPFNYLR